MGQCKRDVHLIQLLFCLLNRHADLHAHFILPALHTFQPGQLGIKVIKLLKILSAGLDIICVQLELLVKLRIEHDKPDFLTCESRMDVILHIEKRRFLGKDHILDQDPLLRNTIPGLRISTVNGFLILIMGSLVEP
ncbi:hypothetical protein D3C81_1142950 [compost metagenome]